MFVTHPVGLDVKGKSIASSVLPKVFTGHLAVTQSVERGLGLGLVGFCPTLGVEIMLKQK